MKWQLNSVWKETQNIQSTQCSTFFLKTYWFYFLHVFLILNENICLGFLKIWRTKGNEMQHSYLSIVLFINCRSDCNPRSRCSDVFKERASNNLHMKCVRPQLFHSEQQRAWISQLGPEGTLPSKLTAQHSQVESWGQ